MLRDTSIVYFLVIGTITILYSLRGIPWIGNILSPVTALLLIYTPLLHRSWRRIEISFFEKNLPQIIRSLRFFFVFSAMVLPFFLILNHFYQTLFLNASLDFHRWHLKWQILLIQVIMVALPEEFFFRGYIQTVLAQKFSKTFRFLGIPGLTMTWAVPITSFIFAFSHSIITFQWWHFAIFFPSLAFGYLREKTDGLVAPILFHAVSNLLVAGIAQVYR